MTTPSEQQKIRDAEGRALAKEHEAAKNLSQGKLDAKNEAWLKEGKADERVQGCGDDGKGTLGFTAERKAEAARIIAGIKPVTRKNSG